MRFTRYNLSGLWYMSVCYIRTKLFYKKSRIIRFPFNIRGGRYIDLGEGLTTGIGCRLEAIPISNAVEGPIIKLGRNVQINDYVHFGAIKHIWVGDNVLIASKVFISDHNHGVYSGENQSSPLSIPGKRELSYSPVVIEDNVWLGEFVSVLPGVTIGKGSIVGSNSVVSKSIPEYSIAVGSPAKVIKQYNFDTEKWEKVKKD